LIQALFENGVNPDLNSNESGKPDMTAATSWRWDGPARRIGLLPYPPP
jgi:hypothetical protein